MHLLLLLLINAMCNFLLCRRLRSLLGFWHGFFGYFQARFPCVTKKVAHGVNYFVFSYPNLTNNGYTCPSSLLYSVALRFSMEENYLHNFSESLCLARCPMPVALDKLE